MVDQPLTVEENPNEADSRVVLEGLREFNLPHVGPSNHVPLGVFVRDGSRVLGGATGWIRYRWLFVDILWLPASMRGQGIGSRVMEALERHALKRECVGIHLTTGEHQALPFYERLGFDVFGVLEDYPPGVREYYLRKRLTTSHPAP